LNDPAFTIALALAIGMIGSHKVHFQFHPEPVL